MFGAFGLFGGHLFSGLLSILHSRSILARAPARTDTCGGSFVVKYFPVNLYIRRRRQRCLCDTGFVKTGVCVTPVRCLCDTGFARNRCLCDTGFPSSPPSFS